MLLDGTTAGRDMGRAQHLSDAIKTFLRQRQPCGPSLSLGCCVDNGRFNQDTRGPHCGGVSIRTARAPRAWRNYLSLCRCLGEKWAPGALLYSTVLAV